MSESQLRLVRADAFGVLEEYDHSLRLGDDETFVIVYGPNGVGKTKFLEIIHSSTRLNGVSLSSLPFREAILTYSDGSTLTVTRSSAPSLLEEPEGIADRTPVHFALRRPGLDGMSWNYEADDFEAWAHDHSPFEQLSSTLWRDPNDGEIVHIDELRERYGRIRRSDGIVRQSPPEEMRRFLDRAPTFLIETQRLRSDFIEGGRYRLGDSRRHRTESRIKTQAKSLVSKINEAQTEHSRITQQQDRTFPSRVLTTALDPEELDPVVIRHRYDEQNAFRSRLGKVASVNVGGELSLPDGSLDDWALRLLKLYLDDAQRKLRPFEGLLEKIELLEQIVNSHFLHKKLQVTDRDGLRVTKDSDGRILDLDSLSSGEQHEIILLIDLLFNVPSGGLVLIDEPEISLHIAWQMAFIPDVRRIADLAGFRFVVATHSPQIINDQWSHARRLGPAEVRFE